MMYKEERYVRFKDTNSERSYANSEQNSPNNYGLYQMKVKPSIGTAMESIRRGFTRSSGRIRSLTNLLVPPSPSSERRVKKTDDPHQRRKTILDPQGSFLQLWNKIFVLTCIVAVSFDPLFLYIPVINGEKKCLDLDTGMKITACVLRTVTDLFYVLHIVFQFRTGFIAPSSRVFGKGELIQEPRAIAKKYLSSYFIVDILSILPLPQVVLLVVIPARQGPVSLLTKDLLKYVVIFQYIPRTIRIYWLFQEVTRTSGIFAETPWFGAAFNLFLYMLASHGVGALWYLLAIERQDTCWRQWCRKNEDCKVRDLYCDENHGMVQYAFANESCPLLEQTDIKNSTVFDFGILLDALQSHVVETRDFPKKLFYCFWWGLRNLSSLGQNLKTSTFVGEILFAIFIAIVGLVLFAFLIGNMQKYLQSITVRVEEMRVKRRDTELWMSHRMLPEDLRARIRRYEQYKWQENRGVDEESLIHNLPKDLKRDIKRHLCLSLLTRVPMFVKMDDQLLDAMCDRLKPVLYTGNSCVVREGDPVDEMLFVMRGEMLTMTTNGGRTGFFNSSSLKPGDFCGEELLPWALDPTTSSLPSSTRTVKAVGDVEAFALKADDFKFVASQFRRRLHSKGLQHTFRFYSHQWRTWGACFIQAAWRRYCRRKMEKDLWAKEERRLQDALAKTTETSSPSLGAAIYASRFAANALHTVKQHRTNAAKLPPKLPPIMLQKPAEPDFSADGDN